MSVNFNTPPDAAYDALRVKKPGQKWYAFDCSMEEARKGAANRFVMTVWNYHAEISNDGAREWAILFDCDTRTYWYKVAHGKEGEDPKNRVALWNALIIAKKSNISMQAILKDQKTRYCSLFHVFTIGQVLMQDDGSAIWLKLEATELSVGTEVSTDKLPKLIDFTDPFLSRRKARSPKLDFDQYSAGCRWACNVYDKKVTISEALEVLEANHQINRNTSKVLLNNYRCLVDGIGFKAPMSVDAIEYYVDEIIGKRGDQIAGNVLAALKGYSSYALKQWGNSAIQPIQDRLSIDIDNGRKFQDTIDMHVHILEQASLEVSNAVSEVLRTVWLRGAQHSAFRRSLMKLWSNRCAVHQVECNGQLRASHIVPWSADKEIRGNSDNGLLLSVPLDCLFDQGLISFSDDGILIAANNLEPDTARLFGLHSGLRLAWDKFSEELRQGIRSNLKRHRERHNFEHH